MSAVQSCGPVPLPAGLPRPPPFGQSLGLRVPCLTRICGLRLLHQPLPLGKLPSLRFDPRIRRRAACSDELEDDRRRLRRVSWPSAKPFLSSFYGATDKQRVLSWLEAARVPLCPPTLGLGQETGVFADPLGIDVKVGGEPLDAIAEPRA